MLPEKELQQCRVTLQVQVISLRFPSQLCYNIVLTTNKMLAAHVGIWSGVELSSSDQSFLFSGFRGIR